MRKPPPKPSRITIPERCHPMVKVLFAEMQRQSLTYDEVEHYSGVLRSTFKAWRHAKKPGLETIEATLGVVGWAVLPVPRVEHLPPKIQAGLEALAAEWEGENPLLCQLLATVCKVPILGELRRAETENVVPFKPRRTKKRTPHPDQVALFDEPQQEAAA